MSLRVNWVAAQCNRLPVTAKFEILITGLLTVTSVATAAVLTASTAGLANPARPAAQQDTASPAAETAQDTSTAQSASPASTPAQPAQPIPRRGVILTPSVPTRTIIPPPTTAFPYEEAYTLGAGDQIQLDIFDVPELSGATTGRYVVQLDGSVNLTWAGNVSVQGLTLKQAEERIEAAYASFIRDPLITVSVVSTRSLRITLAGEIKRPGAYVISPEGATDNRILIDGAAAGGGVANQWPTVTKALQAAGGITQFADLRRVQVRRPLADGSLEVIDLNLWELLRTGEQAQDIRLRDRDTLLIPTATTLNDSEALVIGGANFSPQTIRVNVIGEVPTPGVIEVPANTPMNQALLAAGGFLNPRARTSEVDLVRLNSNGTAVRRTVSMDLSAGINDASNPALRDYDTIIVSRNGATATRERVENVLAPVTTFTGIFDTFFGLFDTFNIIDD
jgi:polysaccharide biosynthesis/export protein